MRDPGGPAIVLGLLLIETAIGAMAILWTVRLWGAVKWGFFKLAGATIVVCAWLGWLALRGPLLDEPVPTSAQTADKLLLAFAVATLIWQLLLWFKQRQASRIVGLVSIPVGVAALVALGLDPAASSGAPIAIAQLFAGALFAGAVLDGLLLGHWHLVDRKLGTAPIARFNNLLLAGAVAVMVTAIPMAGGGGDVDSRISPLLGAGDLVVWLAIGLAALCLVIGLFIRALVKEGSIQSATGLFYLGVLMGFAAEFAAKVEFF
jgi:hypothetical protein